jgi:hypothetical protein
MKKMPTMTFWQLATSKPIRIPIIQRDYAQGRVDRRVRDVRNKFLQALHDAVSGKKTLLLDFVYGEDENGSFVPFDGQQRLTTLFLLHWYAVTREGRLKDHTAHCLKNFQYEVRDGARLFGQELVDRPCPPDHPVLLPYDGAKPHALSAFVIDQSWFRPNWVHDPTIMGMLTMLDAIHGQFHDMPDLWERLIGEGNPPISFFFEQLGDLGSSAEDIFIKMNARGKQLTDFEHFKAQFLDYLAVIAPEKETDIALKLDNQWMDVFWFLFARDTDVEDKAAEADACFGRYLAYISGFLNGLPWEADDKEAPAPQPEDLFQCVRSALASGREQLCPDGNLHFLTTTLDNLHALLADGKDKNGIGTFFDSYFTAATPKSLPIAGKISLFGNSTNLFTLCCQNSLSHTNRFMLAGCLLALTTGLEYNNAAARRLRILRNILEHSSREFVDTHYADQIRGVYSLVAEGRIEAQSRFNTRQIEEEKAKAELRDSFPNDAELHNALDYLEDHPLLRGRLAVFSQKDHAGEGFYFNRETVLQGKRFFELAFGETPVSYDILVRGLLGQDDYALREGSRLYLGSEGAAKRQDIFATPDQQGFPRVRNAVQSLVAKTATAKNGEDLERMIDSVAETWAKEQQAKGEMDWRFYFVKYPAMRPDYCETQGFYHWGYSPKSFNQLHLKKTTRRSEYWNPFLWAAYVEAGYEEEESPRVKWQDCQGSEEKPLIFSCGLALWWDEFFWVLGNRKWENDLTKKQKALVEELQKQFPNIDEKGWLLIPGENSDPKINYADVQGEQHRKYDTVDRVQLILPVIKALAAIK